MKIYWNKESNSKNLIGQRVKELRTEKHMSQKTLAEQLQLAGYEFSDLTVPLNKEPALFQIMKLLLWQNFFMYHVNIFWASKAKNKQ